MESFGKPYAHACIRGGAENPGLRGRAAFYLKREGTLVTVSLEGLPETQTNFFALHIHEGGDCTGEGFPNTGSHYDPEGLPHPRHPGDLPPLLACQGRACMAVVTNRFRPCQIIGRTLVIHNGPDDFTTQAAGNAGTKIACGRIRSCC